MPRPRRDGEFSDIPFSSVAIVSDDQMQPTGDPSQVDGDMRCGRVTLDIGHRLLGDAKERPLHLERQRVDYRARSELDGEPCPVAIPVQVLSEG